MTLQSLDNKNIEEFISLRGTRYDWRNRFRPKIPDAPKIPNWVRKHITNSKPAPAIMKKLTNLCVSTSGA